MEARERDSLKERISLTRMGSSVGREVLKGFKQRLVVNNSLTFFFWNVLSFPFPLVPSHSTFKTAQELLSDRPGVLYAPVMPWAELSHGTQRTSQ